MLKLASPKKAIKSNKANKPQKRKITTKRAIKKPSRSNLIRSTSHTSLTSLPSFQTNTSSSFSTDATTAPNSSASTATDDSGNAPQYYMGPDLYTMRPTNVREGARIIRAFCNTPIDQPISFSINLGLDPRKPNQSVRGMAPVPHGSGGKTILAVFATGDKAIEAKDAGADIVGAEDLIKEILTGKIEFTRCVATPDMMKHLSKVARILGPKGLMPNPKLGTVTTDIKTAVENSKQGQIEFRNDKKGVVHAIVGKSSWSPEKLEENINAFVKAIADAKPSGAKGQYFKSAFIGNNSGWAQNIDIRLYPFKQ